MKKLTREQILDLRNSFGVWQQDYDSVHDKEQHDMFALAVVAMDEMLAAMDGEDAERREWMARGVELAINKLKGLGGKSYSPYELEYLSKSIRAGEVE